MSRVHPKHFRIMGHCEKRASTGKIGRRIEDVSSVNNERREISFLTLWNAQGVGITVCNIKWIT